MKESNMVGNILRWVFRGLISVVILISIIYFWDITRAYERIRNNSTVIPSPYGDIEYTEKGSGPAVLVIHGSGGGYDQGELLARAILGDQFHWITPSRFGYLRSTFHEGASFDDQAHAYAYLLDQLGIKKVAVVVISHGGPSALLFAVLYPERVSTLTLISCGVASLVTQDQKQANQKGEMLVSIYKHDLLYWGITKLFKKRFIRLMGADDTVIAGLNTEQRTLVEHIIDDMNPASLRAVGAAFDNKSLMPNERIADVRAPTLIFHAADDTLQLYHNAVFAASTIPDAKLVRFEKGGHLLFSIEQSTIRTIMHKHILAHISE